MKMIIAIVNDAESEGVAQKLLDADYRVTKLASTAGFLRGGVTTLMVGVADESLENALNLIRGQFPSSEDEGEVQATIYVLNVKDSLRI